jgi:hypothetical protein
VKELVFRGKDRYRPGPGFAGAGVALVIQGVIGYTRLGAVGMCWLVGLSAAALVVGLGAAFRSSTKVGPAGITIFWGLGFRGRTYPWRKIRWIDVRETRSGYGTFLSAQITLANGRVRRLPALRHTSQYPQPTFYSDFRRVVEWWEQSTDPAARFRPRESLVSKLAPPMLVTLLVLLIAAGVLFATGIPGHAH